MKRHSLLLVLLLSLAVFAQGRAPVIVATQRCFRPGHSVFGGAENLARFTQAVRQFVKVPAPAPPSRSNQ